MNDRRHMSAGRLERLESRKLLTTGACAPVITTQGDNVTIVGTADDDVVELVLGQDQHRLNFSGFEYSFDAQIFREIWIGGGFGNNSIRIVGSELDDRASAIGLNGSMTSSTYTALSFSFQSTSIDGGAGGDDYAQIYGSQNDDTLQGLPEESVLSTPTSELSARAFSRVDMYGRGGNDYAQIYGTQQADHFVATENYTLLTGPGMTKYTKGFERVDAYGRGGTDRSELLGSSRNDSVVVTSDYTYLNNGQRLSYAKGFEEINVSEVAGGFNQTTFYDVTADDLLNVSSNTVTLQRGQFNTRTRVSGMDAVTLRDPSNVVIDDQLAEFAGLLGDLEPYLPAATLDEIAQRFSQNRNLILGTATAEEILGSASADEIMAGAGSDVVFAGNGNDLVRGQGDNDSLVTMNGADLAFGGNGNDELRGGAGNDVLLGGPGNDIIDGEFGTDYVSGGTGSDLYRFVALDGTVVITDYDPSQDRIELINIDAADITTNSQWEALTLNHPEGLNIVLLGLSPALDLGELDISYETTETQTIFDPNS